MAKKQREPVQDPPTASLSKEESSDEDSSSEEEEEEKAKSAVQTSSGEPESDSEPEVEEKEKAKRKMQRTEALMKKRKRQQTEATTSVTVREEQVNKENDEKNIGTETTKKNYFQRIWTEGDELVILNGLINFKRETGTLPHAEDIDVFYESVKDSLEYEGKNPHRVFNKVRTLKRKYLNKKKSGVASFSKPFDKECFELSELIWGSEVETMMKKVKLEALEPEAEMVEADWIMKCFVGETISRFGMDAEHVKKRWGLLPAETKKKVYDEWKMMQGKSTELVLQKTGFVHQVASLLAYQPI